MLISCEQRYVYLNITVYSLLMRKPSKILIGIIGLMIVIVGVLAYEQYLRGFQKSIIVLATTTSTYDSGLLDYLMPIFERKYNAEVHIISVGTGQAIETAKRGDADLVLVHSRQLELEFVNSTYGIHRVGVMYNDFVIIGPTSDSAGINGLANATEAFRRIADAGAKGNAIFISRADKSGTNMLELSIWKRLGMTPSIKTQTWYLEAGAGMGTVLRMANEKGAYTLTDRATWLSFKNQLTNLKVLVEGDVILLNPYAIILVNPEKWPQRNYKGALKLAKWMISEEGQNLIANFKKEDETLFKPLARDFNKAHELGFPEQEKEIAWYDGQNP
jgi:tungstate transport system substrate-binding protein